MNSKEEHKLTEQECKNILQRVRKAQFELKAKEEELEQYKNDCYSLSATDYSKEKLTGGKTTDTSDMMARLMQLRDAVNEQWDKLINFRLEANIRINNMHDPVKRALLTQRYILAKSWKEVARFLYISEDHAKGKLHGRAIREFIKENTKEHIGI